MKTVITYGTFDLFHKGHYNILKRAKEAGDYLIVGVTGENYDAERGKLSVQDSLAKRIENVKNTGFADKIIVEEYLGQKIQDIIKYNVDVFVIGSDWKGKFDHLNKYCEVVYLERTKDISSTQIREEVLNIYKLGIVTDDENDGESILESQNVSGIHVESVFSDDKEVAANFADKYELDKGFTNYNAFLKTVDIVYIKTERNKRYEYIKDALVNGKHVIADTPFSLDTDKNKELFETARNKKVMLLDNLVMVYIQTFNQLIWMTKGNLIGDLLSIKCGINGQTFAKKNYSFDFYDMSYYPICLMYKLLGENYNEFNYKLIKSADGNILYGAMIMDYNSATGFAEIGMNAPIEDGVVITGTKGKIIVPNEWWKVGYFEMISENGNKRYSMNFDGTGFRYLVREIISMMKNDVIHTQRLLPEESIEIMEIISSMKNN